jgi:hypothetical protein
MGISARRREGFRTCVQRVEDHGCDPLKLNLEAIAPCSLFQTKTNVDRVREAVNAIRIFLLTAGVDPGVPVDFGLGPILPVGGVAESTRARTRQLSQPGTTWQRFSMGCVEEWRSGGVTVQNREAHPVDSNRARTAGLR